MRVAAHTRGARGRGENLLGIQEAMEGDFPCGWPRDGLMVPGGCVHGWMDGQMEGDTDKQVVQTG